MKNTTALLAKRADHKTSHILHLIMSVITAGLWLPVWLLCGISNHMERGRIDKKLENVE